ncbi:uncharacterized protein LOC136031789 [Artemia franciscana]|uniref:uncharacterized protein LOC136031789 n=1 Tax=Artemia franciscana TaxID=6661 RepID=UPI0032DAE5D1
MTVLNSDIHGLNDDNHCDVISLLGTVSGFTGIISSSAALCILLKKKQKCGRDVLLYVSVLLNMARSLVSIFIYQSSMFISPNIIWILELTDHVVLSAIPTMQSCTLRDRAKYSAQKHIHLDVKPVKYLKKVFYSFCLTSVPALVSNSLISSVSSCHVSMFSAFPYADLSDEQLILAIFKFSLWIIICAFLPSLASVLYVYKAFKGIETERKRIANEKRKLKVFTWYLYNDLLRRKTEIRISTVTLVISLMTTANFLIVAVCKVYSFYHYCAKTLMTQKLLLFLLPVYELITIAWFTAIYYKEK